jgi:NAD(P)-dependent dehydrogenase (short-subunit alcohol dehydrogenase family)
MSEDVGASDLSGRVVVVTGAARGMGAATTKALLKAGAKVAALDLSWNTIDDYWSEVGDFRRELEGHGGNALTLEGDITSDEALDHAYDAVIEHFGTVDALINNAALLQHHLFRPTGRVNVLDTRDEDWERMFGVNVVGTLKVIRRFVRPMLENGGGSIANIITSGTVPGRYRPQSQEQPYMASKAAVSSMSVYLAHELGESNVAVNAVIPGHAEMTGWELVDQERLAAGMRVPSSRQVPEHIAPVLCFLAGHDASNGPTGQLIDTNEWNLHHGLGTSSSWLRENVQV